MKLLFGSLLACFVLMGLSFSSCNKKVSSYNADFVGTWRTLPDADTTYGYPVRSEIVIEKRDGLFNNTCKDTCAERLCDCLSEQSGRAVVNFDKNRIRIGSSSSYSLSIEQEPYQDASGQWVMKLDGDTYYKE